MLSKKFDDSLSGVVIYKLFRVLNIVLCVIYRVVTIVVIKKWLLSFKLIKTLHIYIFFKKPFTYFFNVNLYIYLNKYTLYIPFP